LNPAVLAVTVPENFSAVGLLAAPLTYPGHFLAEVVARVAVLNVAVVPLVNVTVPPADSAAAVTGTADPPVLAPLASTHPLMVMVVAADPLMVEQVVLPFGPLAAEAGPLASASDSPDAGMASAAASKKIRLM
jgi:hypothetical protein